MYEAIEKVAKKFQALRDHLNASTLNQADIQQLCVALDKTAQEISQRAQKSRSSMESTHLAKLYQGILAAKRIVENLAQERRLQTLKTLAHQNVAVQLTEFPS